jgi:hypothetical protein
LLKLQDLLRCLLRKTKCEWTSTQEEAFRTLKEALRKEPILKFLDFRKPFILETDASGVAIGAVLSQKIGDKEHPVAYASRVLNKAAKNYSVTERELLTVVWSTKYFRCYLYGNEFTVITDHSALRWLLSLKEPGSRLMMWVLRLSQFRFSDVHKPGKQHKHADALSRAVGVITTKEFNPDTNLVKSLQMKELEYTKWLSQIDNFRLDEYGVLYKMEKGREPRLVVPIDLRPLVLHNYHDTPFGGHQGQRKTYDLMKKLFYWPKMKTEVEHFVAVCNSCNERKTGRVPVAPLQHFEAVLNPFSLVSMNVVGPLPKTTPGNVYLLTFMGAFSKYSEAIPIPDQTAETIAREFVSKIIARHGCPLKLLTDQGKNFTSKLMREVCKLLHIKKIQTSHYHPMCNRQVERSHSTFTAMVSHFVRTDQRDWDKWDPIVQMAYRSTPHTITGYSPFFLLHGREMTLPFPLDVKPKLRKADIEDDNVKTLAHKLEKAYKVVRGKIKRGKDAQAKWYKCTKTSNSGLSTPVIWLSVYSCIRERRVKETTQTMDGSPHCFGKA